MLKPAMFCSMLCLVCFVLLCVVKVQSNKKLFTILLQDSSDIDDSSHSLSNFPSDSFHEGYHSFIFVIMA